MARPGDVTAEANQVLGKKQKLQYTKLSIRQLKYEDDENQIATTFNFVQPGSSLAAYDIQDAYIGKGYTEEGNNLDKAGKITLGDTSLYVLRPGDITLTSTVENDDKALKNNGLYTGVQITLSANDYDQTDTDKSFVLATKGISLAHYGIADAKFSDLHLKPNGVSDKTATSYDITLTLGENTSNLLRSSALNIADTITLNGIAPYRTVGIRGVTNSFMVAPGVTDGKSAPNGGSLTYYGIENVLRADFINSLFHKTYIHITSTEEGFDATDAEECENVYFTPIEKDLYATEADLKELSTYDAWNPLSFNIRKVQEAHTADKWANSIEINEATINADVKDGKVVTPIWGQARTFKITDGKNNGEEVSVNGSSEVSLRLPETIIATLAGNADTATGIKESISITIADADNTNSAVSAATVKVGTGITLRLPKTIKASLTGNADTATTAEKLKDTSTINGASQISGEIAQSNLPKASASKYGVVKFEYDEATGYLNIITK